MAGIVEQLNQVTTMDKAVLDELELLDKRGFRTNPYRAGRSMAMGRQGMVSSPNLFATQAGLDVLKNNGSAMDAAIATAAVLAVTEPGMTGLGGDLFFLYYDADEKKVYGCNGTGRSPSGLHRTHFAGRTEIDPQSWETVTVPGTVDGWVEGLNRFGTRSLGELLIPAIRYAEGGYPVTEKTSALWQMLAGTLKNDPWTRQTFLINGKAPKPGQMYANQNMANSLKLVAEGGRKAFYEGPIAEEIVRYATESGGFLSMADFANHSSTWVEPVHVQFEGFDIYHIPPNSQGFTVLLMLNMLADTDFGKLKLNSPEYLHLLLETIKIAYADLHTYNADPEQYPPVEELLSAEYARERRKLVDPHRALPSATPGIPKGKDTVYFCTIDAFGNSASFINSIYYPFGSTITAGKAGFLLQNRGFGFTLHKGHLNEYAPNKRPFHTLSPAMMLKGSDLHMSFGLRGGPIQPQVQLQILLSHLKYGLSIQEAIDLPRCNFLSGNDVQFEPGIPQETLEALEAKEHNILPHTGGIFGSANAIQIDKESGTLLGASDPRSDGIALGY